MSLLAPPQQRACLVGPGGSRIDLADDWQAAFTSRSVSTLRGWFARNCRPRVSPHPVRLSGAQVINSQAAANALVGRVIFGSIQVTADNIELHDFWLFPDTTQWIIDMAAGLHTHLHHIYIDGRGQWTNNHGIGSSAGSFTTINAHHMQIQGVSDGGRLCANSTYEYMYVHNPISFNKSMVGSTWDGTNGVYPHSDGFQMTSGYDTVLRRSFIDMPIAAGPNVVSCVLLQTPSNPIANVTIEENYCAGGGKTFHAYDSGNGVPDNIIFRNNLIAAEWGSSSGGIWHLDDPAKTIRVGNRYVRSHRPVPLTVGALAKPADADW